MKVTVNKTKPEFKVGSILKSHVDGDFFYIIIAKEITHYVILPIRSSTGKIEATFHVKNFDTTTIAYTHFNGKITLEND